MLHICSFSVSGSDYPFLISKLARLLLPAKVKKVNKISWNGKKNLIYRFPTHNPKVFSRNYLKHLDRLHPQEVIEQLSLNLQNPKKNFTHGKKQSSNANLNVSKFIMKCCDSIEYLFQLKLPNVMGTSLRHQEHWHSLQIWPKNLLLFCTLEVEDDF